ncbi:hypothetical protein A5689_17795 [Mycobacterium intracellulare subsp. yongonense]|nr:hypothetical protein A5689_17795 [Mycobacterium intracellulare subsp. yongonense]
MTNTSQLTGDGDVGHQVGFLRSLNRRDGLTKIHHLVDGRGWPLVVLIGPVKPTTDRSSSICSRA